MPGIAPSGTDHVSSQTSPDTSYRPNINKKFYVNDHYCLKHHRKADRVSVWLGVAAHLLLLQAPSTTKQSAINLDWSSYNKVLALLVDTSTNFTSTEQEEDIE